MTAAAIHFAVSYGMGIRLHRLRALLLVAIEADFRLCCRAEYRVPLDVAAVTVRAGNRVHVMFAAVPGRTDIAQVAVHAVGILFRHRRAGVRAEQHYRRPFLSTPHSSGMIAAGAVAGFTLQLPMAEG
jgi:hypothetical protein